LTRLARAVFIILVGATVAAFFTAQRLKGEPAVAKVESLGAVFSPNGDGVKDVNLFRVVLRERAEVSVDVVNATGDAVRRLADRATVGPQAPLRLRWDGRTDDGDRVPDGRYRVRVTLRREGRSVTVPSTTLVDTRAPRPRVKQIDPGPIVAPGIAPLDIEVGSVSRRLAKRARIYRVDGGASRVVAEVPPATDTRTLQWNGLVDGKPAPPGLYVVQVIARDRAGNDGTTPTEVPAERGESRGTPAFAIRAIAAEPPIRPVTAGRRVTVNVDARGRPFRWRLRRVGVTKPVRQGRAKAKQPATFIAPSGDSGLYLLELSVGKAKTTVPILVQSRERARMLVVVPTMTWTGTEAVDEGWDGVLNTFATGAPISWPRVQPDGLPSDLVDNVGPLLRFLDSAGVRYDLTTDLDLALSASPRASDRPGVLLLGAERWVPRNYARRLRDYVLDGGRLASIGVDSLRRGITIQPNADRAGGRLVRPTQPSQTDPFGTRFQPLRTSGALVTLSLIDGDAGYALLEGFDGTLEGFSAREESDLPESGRGRVLAALGVETAPADDSGDVPEELPEPARPAVVATQLGDGVMIRVGLPEWAHRLGDRQVAQITLNIADILRHLPAQIHTPPSTG
jgi:N,N-dimethylformamidase beta subunit-like protein/flagellar hook capping protein FlgD